MSKQRQELAQQALRKEWEHLSAREQKVLEHVLARVPITHNPEQEFRERRSFGARAADRIAALGGSWAFVLTFVACMIGWVVLNSWLLAGRRPFDPYPYILLNLVLSMLAALQAPIIMMSQNRQADKDRLQAVHDYEVNLKAEIEIRSLHEKIDELRQRHWSELVAMQHEQLAILSKLAAGRGAAGATGPAGATGAAGASGAAGPLPPAQNPGGPAGPAASPTDMPPSPPDQP